MNANLIATQKMAASGRRAENRGERNARAYLKSCFRALGLSCPHVVSHRLEFPQWVERRHRGSLRLPEVAESLPEETAWRYAPVCRIANLPLRSSSAFAGTIVNRLRLPLHRHAAVRRITNLIIPFLAYNGEFRQRSKRLETFALSSLRYSFCVNLSN
jgi:hypothetical protein